MNTAEITVTNSKAAYAHYKKSVAACEAAWELLMAPDAFALCGGNEGWQQLRAAYDVMREEQNRRFNTWLYA